MTDHSPERDNAPTRGDAPRYTGLVVVASTRAAQGIYEDRSGALAVDWLRSRGIDTPPAKIVADADMPAFLSSLFSSVASRPHIILTSGGTGVSPDDQTIEALRPHLDRELPGIAAEFFRVGAAKVPTAILSGCIAGLAGRSFVMALPGFRGGVKDGIAVLDGVLDHLLEQLTGADTVAPEAQQVHGAGHDTTGTGHDPHADHGSDDSGHAHNAHAATGHAHAVTGVHPHGGCCHHDPSIPDPPHVAAQTGKVIQTMITEQPLEPMLDAARSATVTAAMGAVVTFEGVVRDHDGGQLVDALTYSCHPSAPHVLAQVVESVIEDHPEVRAWVAHRTGPLKIGDIAFVVVAAAAHRGPAFAAAGELADRVKAEVPIWKEQALADGGVDWVGLHG